MSTIMPFDFNEHQVRTVTIDGEPWFVGRDVAAALGYANETDALNKHCRGVAKRYPIVDSLGRTQEARVIAEPDVMRLIVSSKLPAAESFERLVFEEILPAIRRTGYYSAPQHPAELVNLADQRMGLIQKAQGIIHPDYLEAQARLVLAEGLGHEATLNAETLPMDVESYLRDRGVVSGVRKKVRAQFGKRLKAAYVAQHGEEPLKVPREINGTMQRVFGYTEQHRKLFDQVFEAMSITQPQLGKAA